MEPKITKRLSRDSTYKKTGKSYQEKLSPNEIKKKLEEYSQVDDITNVPLGTHVRYFTINTKTGDKQFRLGGFLAKIDSKLQYVICQNGTLSWSVQIKNSVFFRKMSFSDMKEELIEKISKKYEDKIQKLKLENKKLKDTLKQIKKEAKKK
jgi:hypothetical protein